MLNIAPNDVFTVINIYIKAIIYEFIKTKRAMWLLFYTLFFIFFMKIVKYCTRGGGITFYTKPIPDLIFNI
jgi:hypothetical protein